MKHAVRLSDLVEGMARRGTPLATETALFIALQTVETLHDGSRRVSPESVQVTTDGTVEIHTDAPALNERETVASIAALVEAISSSLSPATRALIDRALSGDIPSLAAMRAELEASLIPLNRAAARRVLGRLAREHLRFAETATAGSALDTVPDAHANALLQKPTASATTHSDPPRDEDWIPPRLPAPPPLGSLWTLHGAVTATDTEPEVPPLGATPSNPPNPATDTEPDGTLPTMPAESVSVSRQDHTRPSTRLVLALVTLLVLASLAFVLLRLSIR